MKTLVHYTFTFIIYLIISQLSIASDKESDWHYLNSDPQACLTLKFTCESGQYPFFNEQGCGCRKISADQKTCLLSASNDRSFELTEAGITLTVPKEWLKQETQTEWALPTNSDYRFGLKWMNASPEWQITQFLPASSEILTTSDVKLNWGTGTLYTLKINQVSIIPESAHLNTQLFAFHAIFHRVTTGIIYDFYAQTPDLEQLKHIEPIYQRFMQSSALTTF